jgi:hypothetical protein
MTQCDRVTCIWGQQKCLRGIDGPPEGLEGPAEGLEGAPEGLEGPALRPEGGTKGPAFWHCISSERPRIIFLVLYMFPKAHWV